MRETIPSHYCGTISAGPLINEIIISATGNYPDVFTLIAVSALMNFDHETIDLHFHFVDLFSLRFVICECCTRAQRPIKNSSRSLQRRIWHNLFALDHFLHIFNLSLNCNLFNNFFIILSKRLVKIFNLIGAFTTF